MVVKFTNFVFRTQIYPGHANVCCLDDMAEVALASGHFDYAKVNEGRPRMLVLKQFLTTVIIFTSGKMRLMGSVICSEDAARKFFKRYVIKTLMKNQHRRRLFIGDVHLQTKSATFDCEQHIDLNAFHQFINKLPTPHDVEKAMPSSCNFYSAELFPALSLKIWGGDVHMNIFASGKCVMNGLRDNDQCYIIANQIVEYLNVYK